MPILDKSALDPVAAMKQSEDPQENSLCNLCAYGFRYTQQSSMWNNSGKLELCIHCTHPALGDDSRTTHGVKACNAYTEGPFDPMGRFVESLNRTLQINEESK